MGELMRLMRQIQREREITATERMMMNSTVTTTVYSGPGYPIDPRMDRQRDTIDTLYSCVMTSPITHYEDPIDRFIESDPDEPKDLAAVRRIIKNWENPDEMSAAEYIDIYLPRDGVPRTNSRQRRSPATESIYYEIP